MISFKNLGSMISNYFDSDYIDIKRNIGGELVEVYSNIPCHISYSNVDNPDSTSVDVTPVIQTLIINMQNYVDVKNNDYIIAKKTDGDGNLLATYNGRCGFPTVSQGRKKIQVVMNSTSNEQGTDLPSINPVNVHINYVDEDGISINSTVDKEYELGSDVTINPIDIDGYSIDKCYINNEEQTSTTIYINNIQNVEYTIKFVYKVNEVDTYFRFLIKGLYTDDSGNLKNGYHLYKKIYIDSLINVEDDEIVITCDDINMLHEDNNKTLKFESGVKLVLFPSKTYYEVGDFTVANYKATVDLVKFTPTSEEESAYITNWYE